MQTISYSQFVLTQDQAFIGRISSILKDEGYSPAGESAADMAGEYAADIAAQPGLAEAYHAALLNEVPDPGAADDVITDGALLSAVVAVLGPAG